MKFRINIDETLEENEFTINCKEYNEQIDSLAQLIKTAISERKQITFFKDQCEYYLPIQDILFFETDGNTIQAHTLNDIYSVHYKLYELEEILPKYFMRVSKSTILNINKIYGINRNITTSVTIEFKNCQKQVYVSRMYYKLLKERLKEKRTKL